jgi:4-hydroxy-L-threonine phosphate dehydrogenase PdxA
VVTGYGRYSRLCKSLLAGKRQAPHAVALLWVRCSRPQHHASKPHDEIAPPHIRNPVAMITPAHVGRVIRATDTALKRLGIAGPKIFVGGLNPHAGEGGLFGREEIDAIAPAIAAARTGIDVEGPFGCDTMFQKEGVDAFIVMLLAVNQSAALAIGSPVVFSSVAHGSAFDIAGKGVASPAALIAALRAVTGN